jgi:hypothetical protein
VGTGQPLATLASRAGCPRADYRDNVGPWVLEPEGSRYRFTAVKLTTCALRHTLLKRHPRPNRLSLSHIRRLRYGPHRCALCCACRCSIGRQRNTQARWLATLFGDTLVIPPPLVSGQVIFWCGNRLPAARRRALEGKVARGRCCAGTCHDRPQGGPAPN